MKRDILKSFYNAVKVLTTKLFLKYFIKKAGISEQRMKTSSTKNENIM